MIYRPQTGSMWDPSVLWHDGRYYAFMMYNKDGPNGLDARHCFLASSEDGVHWRDEGIVNEEREREHGCKFFKCFVGKCGDSFIMDHGVARPQGQDTLRFYESKDLRNWTYLFSNSPDTRWYVPHGRWDHMYILAKEEGNPAAGYWGYPVATPKQGLTPGLGMMESKDGREWTVLPPPEIEWGATPQKNLEIGGCERIGGNYVIIGGYADYISDGYSMYTLISHGPRGPFRPDVEAYRLCGTSAKSAGWGVQFLAAWARAGDGLLISNYVSVPSGTRMLPLRKPVLENGRLRLGWWSGNEALKGRPLPLEKQQLQLCPHDRAGGYRVVWLDAALDLKRGVVLEGEMRAVAAAEEAESRAGFVFQEAPERAMSVQLGVGKPEGRETHIGRLVSADDGKFAFICEDITGKGCATVTGIEGGKQHLFRLLLRHDLFELYIDNLLMQTYVYKPSAGRLGFMVRNASAAVSRLRAWEMSLSDAD